MILLLQQAATFASERGRRPGHKLTLSYIPHLTRRATYIADSENFRVRKVTPDGIITTVAGNGTWGRTGERNEMDAALDAGSCGTGIRGR